MQSQLPRILVGVDFSESSDRAVEETQRLALQMGAQIDFAHIAPHLIDSAMIERARHDLELLEQIARREGFVAKAHLVVGDPAAGLLELVARLKPALVVVGRHGRGAVMRLLMGSVAESLIRQAHVPVLVVPEAAAENRRVA